MHTASGSYAGLLYASGDGEVAILTYPGGNTVGSIINGVPAGVCTDPTNGNVWVVTQKYKGFYAFEYAYGATTSIGQVKIPQALLALECAVDASNHNVAITNWTYAYGQPYIDVWTGTGVPSHYAAPFSPQSIVYDDQGNLFAVGASLTKSFQFAELPKGSSKFTEIHLDRPAAWPGGIAWDGKYVVVGHGDRGAGRKFERIDRVRIAGSQGHVVSSQEFQELPKRNLFWLQDDTLIAAQDKARNGDAFWHYPQGGNPFKTGVGTFSAYYVAVSVLPSNFAAGTGGLRRRCGTSRSVDRCLVQRR